MVLSSSQHVSCSLDSVRGLGCGRVVRDVIPLTRGCVVSTGCGCWPSGAASSTLTTSGCSEADVGITDLIEHTAVTVLIVASVEVGGGRLAQRDACLKHRALHVINEDSEVSRAVVAELALKAVVGAWVLGASRLSVLAVTTRRDVGIVQSTTQLVVSAVVGSISLLTRIIQLRPVLDLDGVVLAIGKVGDGWGGSEVLVPGMIRLHSRVGGEDGHMVVVVADELGGIDPPAAHTLLGVVQLKVVPCVELHSKNHGRCFVARLEAADTTITTARVGHLAQGADLANVGVNTIVVVVAQGRGAGSPRCATVTSPVVLLLASIDLGVTEARASAANLLVVLLLDDEGETITTTAEAGWVEYRVATRRESSNAELEGGLETVEEVHLRGVVQRTLGLGLRGSETHDSLVVIVADHVGILVLGDSQPFALVIRIVGGG